MEHQTSSPRIVAQSSIRSFFQPLLHQQNHAPPGPPLPPQKTTSLTPKLTLPSPQSPPPPVKLPSSYALPPSQTLKTSPPNTSQQPSRSQKSILPEGATIRAVNPDHIPPLRRINALLLPINYPDSFYNSITSPSSLSDTNFSRAITWDNKVVGGIICRPEISLPLIPINGTVSSTEVRGNEGDIDIYIQSLCLLSPYRGKGLASSALDEVIQAATHLHQGNTKIKGLYAHVWTSNEEALQWYAKQGFTIWERGMVHGYYRRLKPDTAWILRRDLRPSDHLVSMLPPVINPELEGKVEEKAELKLKPPPSPLLSPNTPEANKLRPPPHQARSFQDRGPDREWNDLPDDAGLLKPRGGSNGSSRSSSRSGLSDGTSIVGRGKKKRVYPAAAFGA